MRKEVKKIRLFFLSLSISIFLKKSSQEYFSTKLVIISNDSQNNNIIGKEFVMFSVSLDEIMATRNFESVLILKSKLLAWKKSGMIFFQEEICQLGTSQKFFLYWSDRKGSCKTQPNAFPVPREDWKTIQFSNNELLLPYFASYYELIQIPHSFLENLKMYIGEEFVWFYK